MNLTEYLEKRGSKTLGIKEAGIIGVPFPLQRNWAKTYKNFLVPEDAFIAHKEMQLQKRDKKKNKKTTLSKSIIAVAKEKYPDLLGSLTSKKVKKYNFQNQKKAKVSFPVNITKYPENNKINVNADEFLTSYHWRKIRMEVLIRDGRKCACCGATPATGAVMNVDHIKPRRFYPELALEITNLQILCGDCNHGKGNWDETNWREANRVK